MKNKLTEQDEVRTIIRTNIINVLVNIKILTSRISSNKIAFSKQQWMEVLKCYYVLKWQNINFDKEGNDH